MSFVVNLAICMKFGTECLWEDDNGGCGAAAVNDSRAHTGYPRAAATTFWAHPPNHLRLEAHNHAQRSDRPTPSSYWTPKAPDKLMAQHPENVSNLHACPSSA